MVISLTDLFSVPGKRCTEPITFERSHVLTYKVLSFESEPVSIVHEKDRIISIHISCKAELSMRCDRCLKPVKVRIVIQADRRIDALNMLDEDGEPVDFIDHDDFLIDDFLEEIFVENLPMKVLCKEDCKGLCPTCGKDLNEGPCDCEKKIQLTPMQEALMKALNNTDN